MDCGTTIRPDSAVHAPEVVDVSLTMTDKACPCWKTPSSTTSHALLVGVLSGGCSGYMYDLQIVESTETPCQELNINGFRVAAASSIAERYRNRLRGSVDGWWLQNQQSKCQFILWLWRILRMRPQHGHGKA